MGTGRKDSRVSAELDCLPVPAPEEPCNARCTNEEPDRSTRRGGARLALAVTKVKGWFTRDEVGADRTGRMHAPCSVFTGRKGKPACARDREGHGCPPGALRWDGPGRGLHGARPACDEERLRQRRRRGRNVARAGAMRWVCTPAKAFDRVVCSGTYCCYGRCLRRGVGGRPPSGGEAPAGSIAVPPGSARLESAGGFHPSRNFGGGRISSPNPVGLLRVVIDASSQEAIDCRSRSSRASWHE